MSKFARFMQGLWVIIVMMILLLLVEALSPELYTEYKNLWGVFFFTSVITTTSIWTSE